MVVQKRLWMGEHGLAVRLEAQVTTVTRELADIPSKDGGSRTLCPGQGVAGYLFIAQDQRDPVRG